MDKKITKPDSFLFDVIEDVLHMDLADPKTEALARQTLRMLRQNGLRPQSADLEDPDCLACLHLSLMSALHLAPDDHSLPN